MIVNCQLIFQIIVLIVFRLISCFDSNHDLIQHLKDQQYIRSAQVETLMLSIDRANFVDSRPYDDSPKFIGYGVTISAPHMHAIALELVASKLLSVVYDDARILDVGSGSGYLTACFAKMVGSNGLSLGIDHIDELVQQSIKNVNKIPETRRLLESGKLIFKTGDGREGFSKLAPYDVIHVGAASETVPDELVKQLKIGGILLCPIGKPGDQFFTVVTKLEDGSVHINRLMSVRYVLLTDKDKQLRIEL